MFSRFLIVTLPVLVLILSACSDSSDDRDTEPPLAAYDFSAVDARLDEFLEEQDFYKGISITVVDTEQGTVHEAAMGTHTTDIVVMLASTSKVPSVMLMMAIDEDESLDFDVTTTIDNYLPWEGVNGGVTVEQMLSNTSGIPGLGGTAGYGPHLCQFIGSSSLEVCGELMYANPVAGTVPPGTAFSYGGTPWHLSGAVAEQVTNSRWNQAFDKYLGEPCDLEVFTYGNVWDDLTQWTGSPDSLVGQDNAHVEGGAITNMQDYAKLLLVHLRGGQCGDEQVLSQEALDFMRIDRSGEFGPSYGMGWWIQNPEDGSEPTVFYDPGLFGAVSWIDTERGIGGYVAVDEYALEGGGGSTALVLSDIIPLVAQAVDEARAALEQ